MTSLTLEDVARLTTREATRRFLKTRSDADLLGFYLHAVDHVTEGWESTDAWEFRADEARRELLDRMRKT